MQWQNGSPLLYSALRKKGLQYEAAVLRSLCPLLFYSYSYVQDCGNFFGTSFSNSTYRTFLLTFLPLASTCNIIVMACMQHDLASRFVAIFIFSTSRSLRNFACLPLTRVERVARKKGRRGMSCVIHA